VRPAGLYLTGIGVVGIGGRAPVPLSLHATGPSTLSVNGRYLVYEVNRTVRTGGAFVGSSSLRVHDFATGGDAALVPGGSDATFRPDGALVYLHASFRAGSHLPWYQPMERRHLLGTPVSLGPALQLLGNLMPAAEGHALVEVETGMAHSRVELLRAGAAPTRLLPGAARAGVVELSRDGEQALLWFSRGHDDDLALVRLADRHVLGQVDTGVADLGLNGASVPVGVWSGGRAVVAIGSRLLVVSVRGGSLRVAGRLDLPMVSSGGGNARQVAANPQWVRFLDGQGDSVVFTADLALPSLDPGVDFKLFACRLSTARCTLSSVAGGSGMMFVHLAPITQAGESVIAARVAPRRGASAPLIAFADRHSGWIATARGLYVSNRGGASWRRVANVPAAATALDALDARHVWVFAAGRIYRTEDGAHWQRTAQVRPLRQLHFFSARDGYAVTSVGSILTTTDAGAHWALVNSEGNRLSQVCLTASGSGLAVERNKVVDTPDGGRSWGIAYTPPVPPGHSSELSIACSRNVAFVLDRFGERAGHEAYELFASHDGGKRWYLSLQEPYFAQGQFPLYPAASNADTVGPQAGPFVAIGDQSLLISGHCVDCSHDRTSLLATTTGGQTWRPIPRRAFTNQSLGTSGLTTRYPAALDDARPLAISFPTTRDGWLLVRRPTGAGRLARTIDGGANWSVEPTPPGI
jgi:photosystem II stability/assembly factor-like uncharacterized protein